MRQEDLDRLLQRLPTPERSDEYWKDFPGTVLRRTRAGSAAIGPIAAAASGPLTSLARRWLLGFALPVVAVALLILALQQQSPEANVTLEMATLRESYQQVAEVFPRQLEALLFSNGEARVRLSDSGEVPPAPPIYVRICPPLGTCLTAVSFSGQTLEVSGREFEVLENGKGEVFVVAKDGVWGPGQLRASGQQWRIEAGWLAQPL